MDSRRMLTDRGSSHLRGVCLPHSDNTTTQPLLRPNTQPPSDQTPTPTTKEDRHMPVKTLSSQLRYAVRLVMILYKNVLDIIMPDCYVAYF